MKRNPILSYGEYQERKKSNFEIIFPPALSEDQGPNKDNWFDYSCLVMINE